VKPKRRKPFAANNASRKHLEAQGWTVTTVEQRIPHCFITKDAFGFGDLLIAKPSGGIVLVQVTGDASTGNFHKRIAKIKAEPRAGIWLASGGKILVHSWEGKGNNRKLREEWIQDATICEKCNGKGEMRYKNSVGLDVITTCTNCGGTGRIA